MTQNAINLRPCSQTDEYEIKLIFMYSNGIGYSLFNSQKSIPISLAISSNLSVNK